MGRRKRNQLPQVGQSTKMAEMPSVAEAHVIVVVAEPRTRYPFVGGDPGSKNL